jgi:hypothetical protein
MLRPVYLQGPPVPAQISSDVGAREEPAKSGCEGSTAVPA